MAAEIAPNIVVLMSFAAIVFTTLAGVILVLIALGLWSRRRPSDIWEEDVVRSSATHSSIEERDVEEILTGRSRVAEPADAEGARPGSKTAAGRPDRLQGRS